MTTSEILEPGHVLASRYRIKRLIGIGATTATYEAVDLSLQRPVALKLLLPEVLANQEWRDYFRQVVTAVAALHHPNLTRIYDWGELGGVTYFVTEYLAGGSLADALAQRGRLSREQTALMGLEVATALAYAHAREFVHGSLRPSKILFDAEGRARVADLGLAASLATIPRPSLLLELARYSSPEQVLGQPIDGRSDVYSLSLILFECLTGEVPHAGVSIESVRSNRLGAPLPHREELGSLDLLLALGAAPEASARPDAAMFASRLESIATTLPVPRPVSNTSGSTTGFTVPSPDHLLSSPAVAAPARHGDDGLGDPVVRPFDLPGFRESFENSPSRTRTPRRRRTGRAASLLVVILALLVTLAAGVAWKVGLFTPSYKVPSITGLSETAALAAVAPDGFKISVDGQMNSATVLAGDIVTQKPSASTMLKRGSTIHVRLSLGPAPIAIPSIISLTCSQATSKLVALGLHASCPAKRVVISTSVPAGEVVAFYYNTIQDPSSVPPLSTLELAISGGSSTTSSTSSTTTTTLLNGPRAVPNLVGMNRAQTHSAMTTAALYYNVVPGSLNGTWTKVISTNPLPGTIVPWHSNVVVTVQ